MIRHILSKLVTIEKDLRDVKHFLRSNNSEKSVTMFNCALFDTLPLNTVEELETLDEKLMQDDAFGQLVSNLFQINDVINIIWV